MLLRLQVIRADKEHIPASDDDRRDVQDRDLHSYTSTTAMLKR
jgi:hypothetical protein